MCQSHKTTHNATFPEIKMNSCSEFGNPSYRYYILPCKKNRPQVSKSNNRFVKFWIKNLHRTVFFHVTLLRTAILYLLFQKKQHLRKNEACKTQLTAITTYSPLKPSHSTDNVCVWEEAEWDRKGNSISINVKSWWDWMLPGVVPRVVEAKWRKHIVQIFQDATGQHEKVQLHFWGLGGGKGSSDGASVTWNPHSLGRSHHQTLHSQGHPSTVLSIRLQVRPLSSSSCLCFAVKEIKNVPY